MNKYLEILTGLVFVGLGIYGTISFLEQVLIVAKGCISIIFVLVGIVIIWWASLE